MADVFATFNGHDSYGVPRVGPPTATTVGPSVERSAGPAMTDATPPWHPDSPLFWVGAFLLATFGLAGASVRVRAGAAKAGASIGTT